MTLAIIRERVYADYLMPSRLDEYRHLLQTAIERGYAVLSIEAAWARIRAGGLDPDGRYLVLRHDVDTDAGTAGVMWRIEQDLGIGGSYYFRLSTVDVALMIAIAAGGGEASYHYEELATVIKRRRLRSEADVRDHIPEAQELFLQNLGRLRKATGLAMPVVASHGDFANRRVGLSNWILLEDPAIRRAAGIDLEVYDAAFMDHVSSRHADTLYPRFWRTGSPVDAFEAGASMIYLLVHPRHWRVDRIGNATDDARRLLQGVAYDLPFGRRR